MQKIFIYFGILPYVTTYATLSHLYDVFIQRLLTIVSFSTVAVETSRRRINVKVSRTWVRTVMVLLSIVPRITLTIL